jgi:hypothetical protein
MNREINPLPVVEAWKYERFAADLAAWLRVPTDERRVCGRDCEAKRLCSNLSGRSNDMRCQRIWWPGFVESTTDRQTQKRQYFFPFIVPCPSTRD